MTWGRFQIGVTTYDEMLDILAPADVNWDRLFGNVEFMSEDHVDQGYVSVEACFYGDTLSGLNTYPQIDMLWLPYWVEEYGEPDVVTWAYYYEARSMIWAEEGILLVVDVEFVDSVILFPPIPSDELEGSWLMQAMPQENVSPPPTDLIEE